MDPRPVTLEGRFVRLEPAGRVTLKRLPVVPVVPVPDPVAGAVQLAARLRGARFVDL